MALSGPGVPPFRDVVILTQFYAPEPGAPQVRLAALARELARRGARVRVITGMPNYPDGRIQPGYRGRLTMREDVAGVPVRRVWLYAAAGRGSLHRLLGYLSFTLAAAPALLLGRRPDLVFVEAQPLTLALPAWLLGVLRGVPWIYNTPDLQVELAGEAGWIAARPLLALARRLEAFLMGRALAVTTVTRAFVDHFARTRGVPAERLCFLPNGADVAWLRPLPRDAALAARLGVDGRRVVTYAGTHAPYQGLEVLVQAAARLRHRRDVAVLIVGRGPERERLVAAARTAALDNVLFRDVPFADMPRLMSVSDLFVATLRDFPSARGMRLSKAVPPLACGVPVVYAGDDEMAALIEREGCGVRVPPGRPDLLADAIARLVDDPERRRAMGRRGRALAERAFAWPALVDAWLAQVAALRGAGGAVGARAGAG